MHRIQSSAGQRRSRIDIDEDRECRYWAERLGVRPGELKAAVGAVGNDIDELWRYIDALKHDTPAP